jgi:hypothetical protein
MLPCRGRLPGNVINWVTDMRPNKIAARVTTGQAHLLATMRVCHLALENKLIASSSLLRLEYIALASQVAKRPLHRCAKPYTGVTTMSTASAAFQQP